MSRTVRFEDIKEHLQYEIRFLLGAKLLTDATKNDGNIQNYFKDSAYVHVRNLYEFFTGDKTTDLHLNQFGQNKLVSSLYGQWSEALNRRTAHVSPGRIGRNITKEPIGSSQLNEQLENFCSDIESLWQQWIQNDNDRSMELTTIWTNAGKQAKEDCDSFIKKWGKK